MSEGKRVPAQFHSCVRTPEHYCTTHFSPFFLFLFHYCSFTDATTTTLATADTFCLFSISHLLSHWSSLSSNTTALKNECGQRQQCVVWWCVSLCQHVVRPSGNGSNNSEMISKSVSISVGEGAEGELTDCSMVVVVVATVTQTLGLQAPTPQLHSQHRHHHHHRLLLSLRTTSTLRQ